MVCRTTTFVGVARKSRQIVNGIKVEFVVEAHEVFMKHQAGASSKLHMVFPASPPTVATLAAMSHTMCRSTDGIALAGSVGMPVLSECGGTTLRLSATESVATMPRCTIPGSSRRPGECVACAGKRKSLRTAFIPGPSTNTESATKILRNDLRAQALDDFDGAHRGSMSV